MASFVGFLVLGLSIGYLEWIIFISRAPLFCLLFAFAVQLLPQRQYAPFLSAAVAPPLFIHPEHFFIRGVHVFAAKRCRQVLFKM